MKNKYFIILSPVVALVTYLSLTSYSGGISGAATSGCTSCHGSSSTATTITVTGLPPGGYTNGTVYPLTLTITNTGITPGSAGLRDGFVMKSNLGTFTAISGTALASSNTEIRHTTPKAAPGGTTSWTFNWTAPTSGSSTITFNVAGNATNGDGNASSLDKWRLYTTTLAKALPPISITASATPILCNGATSTITTSVTNGVSPFQYQLNSGPVTSTSSFSGINAGTYTVTVSDATSATATTVVTITQPNAFVFNTPTINNPVCNGGTGSAIVNATGGTGTLNYSISPLGPQTNTTGNFNGLTAQVYTVTVIDGNSCSSTTSITVLQPPPLNVTATGAAGCASLPITLSGSPAGGTFSVANPYIGTSTTFTYTYTDGNGCSATSAPASITTNAVLSSNVVTSSGSSFCQTFNHVSGTHSYANTSCQMIAKITGFNLGSTTVCTDFVSGSPTWNGEAYANRVYAITPSTQPSSTVTVCLYYTNTDLTSAGISTNSDISITKVGGNGVLGGAGAVEEIINSSMTISTLAGSITEVCFPVSSFSSFYLHSKNLNNIVLPIVLKDFTGIAMNSNNQLNWTTSSEQNNDHFIVQQSSDGIRFNDIGKVGTNAHLGNSQQELSYQFIDQFPLSDKNYYRLKQVDIDGKVVTSKVIFVQNNAISFDVQIYPNPSKGECNIRSSVPVEVLITDMNGKIIFNESQQTNFNFNLKKSGCYFVKMIDNKGNQMVKKLIVE